MANYKPDLSCQSKFIPIDFSAQIIPGTAAYSPSMMLKIILFGYSRGFITSRRIANACETNIIFMSLSGDSIASFVARMKDNKPEYIFVGIYEC